MKKAEFKITIKTKEKINKKIKSLKYGLHNTKAEHYSQQYFEEIANIKGKISVYKYILSHS